MPADVLRNSRGWTEPQWAAGIAGLAGPPFAALSDEETADLHRALLGCATEIQSPGPYPFPNPIGLPALAPTAAAARGTEGRTRS